MDLIERLAELVAFDTQNPAGDEPSFLRYLEGALREFQPDELTRKEVGRTGFVYAQFGHAPSLLINAHIDTVPANSGYTQPPLQLVQKGGHLYGLGTADTKGAIAAILSALAFQRAQGKPIAPLAVLFSGDEELGGVALRAFLDEAGSPRCERVVVCEPTGCRVGRRHRGIFAATVEVQGEGGHSSGVDRMTNPLSVLARVAVALDDLGIAERDQGEPGFPGLCLNIAAIDGGKAFNVVPSRAKLTVSARPGPGREVRALATRLHDVTLEAARGHAIDWRVLVQNPSFRTRDLAAFRSALGDAVDQPIDLPFWSEAAQFADAGMDAVVYGPGHIGQAHAADEYVEVDQLEQAHAMFLRIVGGGM